MVDGQIDFVRGVFGDRVRTIASESNPNGIPRNGLAWLCNGSVRGGGIAPRTGWLRSVYDAPWPVGLYQGGFLYQRAFGDPYLVIAISGELWRVRVDTDNSVENLSVLFGGGLVMPPDAPHAYFAQADMFLVWQAGDLVTNPIFFWDDGATLIGMRRSLGFVGVNNPTNEIPPATAMDYAQQRLWYTIGNSYIAGDIIQNQSSGSAAFSYRDSILHVTENPVATAGDAFRTPSYAGNIRALAHTSNLDSALGESQMFVFTRSAIFAMTAPVTRDDWTAATLDLQPLQKVVLTQGGTFSERSIVKVNGDLFFNAPPNGDIRSLTVALRTFSQWGQVPISRQENRILQFNDRALLHGVSACLFDNRLLQATSPATTPAGIACRTILPLDFDLVSTLFERQEPAWEGHQEGLSILQLFSGDFGGRERAFAVVWSESALAIEVWEITADHKFDENAGGDSRVTWQVETPSYTWGDPFQLKELETVEIWLDKLLGTAEIKVEYFVDSFPCPLPWRVFKVCSAKDCTQLTDNPCLVESGYPSPSDFCESFRATLRLPKPPAPCIRASGRPSNIGRQFGLRITVKGWCRIRGILAYAMPREEQPFAGLVC